MAETKSPTSIGSKLANISSIAAEEKFAHSFRATVRYMELAAREGFDGVRFEAGGRSPFLEVMPRLVDRYIQKLRDDGLVVDCEKHPLKGDIQTLEVRWSQESADHQWYALTTKCCLVGAHVSSHACRSGQLKQPTAPASSSTRAPLITSTPSTIGMSFMAARVVGEPKDEFVRRILLDMSVELGKAFDESVKLAEKSD